LTELQGGTQSIPAREEHILLHPEHLDSSMLPVLSVPARHQQIKGVIIGFGQRVLAMHTCGDFVAVSEIDCKDQDKQSLLDKAGVGNPHVPAIFIFDAEAVEAHFQRQHSAVHSAFKGR
jgi:hypothetical protein